MARDKAVPKKRKFTGTETIVSKRIKQEVSRAIVSRGIVPEKKFFGAQTRDATLSGTLGTWLGLLNGIAQGDTVLDRSGNRIAISKIEIQMIFDRPEADLALDLNIFQCKWALIVDRQCNETAPNVLQDWANIDGSLAIYTGSNASAAGAYGLLGIKNPNNSERYIIHKEGTVQLAAEPVWNYNAAVERMNAVSSRVVKVVKTFSTPLVVQWSGSTAGVAFIAKNNIGLAFLPSTDETIGVTVNYMLTFTDM